MLCFFFSLLCSRDHVKELRLYQFQVHGKLSDLYTLWTIWECREHLNPILRESENQVDLLELDAMPQRVPAKEGSSVGDEPLLVVALAVKEGPRPPAVLQARLPDLDRVVFVRPRPVALAVLADLNLQKVLLQLLHVRRPPALEVLEPGLVEVLLICNEKDIDSIIHHENIDLLNDQNIHNGINEMELMGKMIRTSI
jgi:hypothetical protein